MSIPRVRTAVAPEGALPAHPAPNADHWGDGETNVHAFIATSAGAHVWTANARATLVRITLSAPCRILVGGGSDVSAAGFLTDAASESFAIPAGASISFQAADGDVAVQILEG